MRGCLQRWKVKGELRDKEGLPKGCHSWDLIVYLGRGANGKPKNQWKRFHGTRDEAQKELTSLVGKVHKGTHIAPTRMTLGEWLDHWLSTAIEPSRAKSTVIGYRGIIDGHIKLVLGYIPLQRVTTEQIEQYYTEKSKELKPASLAVHQAILTTALKAAEKSKRIPVNVARDAMNKPKVHKTEDLLNNVWTAEEAQRFLESVKQHGNAQWAALFALALDSGMRKSELLGLQWKDINGETVRIDRQLLNYSEDPATGKHALETSLPKRGKSRSLELSSGTVDLLREHKRQQAETKIKNRLHYVDYGLVFALDWEHKSSRHSVLGGPLPKLNINWQLDKLCEAAKVPRIVVHGLRHTCATLLISAGVPANVVQQRLGHATVEMTLNIYSHVLPSMQKDAARQMGAMLHG